MEIGLSEKLEKIGFVPVDGGDASKACTFYDELCNVFAYDENGQRWFLPSDELTTLKVITFRLINLKPTIPALK